MNVVLNLTIRRRWFVMIASGEKREEYRAWDNAQVARLWKRAVCNGMPCGAVVVLRAGYCMDSPALAVRLLAMDFRGKGEARHREWGEPLTSHFVLQLGTVLKQGDYSTVKDWCAAAADVNFS